MTSQAAWSAGQEGCTVQRGARAASASAVSLTCEVLLINMYCLEMYFDKFV